MLFYLDFNILASNILKSFQAATFDFPACLNKQNRSALGFECCVSSPVKVINGSVLNHA